MGSFCGMHSLHSWSVDGIMNDSGGICKSVHNLVCTQQIKRDMSDSTTLMHLCVSVSSFRQPGIFIQDAMSHLMSIMQLLLAMLHHHQQS